MKNPVVHWGFKVFLMSMFLGPSPSSVGASNNTTNMASNTVNPAGDGGSPVNKKNQLSGVMFKYGPNSVQVAFKTGDYRRQVIFIGGLTQGFLATDYLMPLATALETEKWSLVQFLMSSSYSGYGTSSLKQDAAEIDELVCHLIKKEDSKAVVLVGHSTGCQVICRKIILVLSPKKIILLPLTIRNIQRKYVDFLFRILCITCVRTLHVPMLFALQSYRQQLVTENSWLLYPKLLQRFSLASKLITQGRGSELMPRETESDDPITAYRYHSLSAYDGDDDMFSSDLSEELLKQRLGHMSRIPCQIIFSMNDEFVPEYVDKKALVDRLSKAMGGAEKVEIEEGNHSLSNRVQEAVQAMIGFITKRRK